MTSDGEALFRAICEEPWEDTPRLMYADWLQENDDSERAEFIRLQCAAHALRPDYLEPDKRSRLGRLLHEHGGRWRAELPIIHGVQWNTLFVRGFIEYADVDAGHGIVELLARAFAAAPLVRLVVHNLSEDHVLSLLECPFLYRLTTLAMPDLRADRLSARAKEELTEAARRLANTSLLYHR